MRKKLLLFLLLTTLMSNAQINLNIGSTDVGAAPVSSFFSYSYVQQIYPKQEINANSAGNITGLIFYVDPSVTISDSSDWTVYLGLSTKTAFTSNTDWVPVTQLTQVFTGTVTNNNGQVVVTFTTPFAYNNTDNLIIATKENSQSIDINNFNEVYRVYPHLPSSTLYYKRDLAAIDPSSPPAGMRVGYKSAVTISGLTPNTTPPCPFVTYPANNQQMVLLSPLIKWLSVLGADSYKVSIGTSAGATDVVNQQVVFTNSFTPSTPLVLNTNYYLRVTSVSGGLESSGCTDVVFKTIPPPPANDVCSGALVATVFPYVYTQSDAAAATNNAGFIGICADAMNDGTWFKFTGDGGVFNIKVTMPASSADFDPQMGVYRGSCGSLLCVGTLDNNGGGGTESANLTTTAGVVYYINVGSYEETVDVPENVFTFTITKL